MAADLRGMNTLMLDFYDDPDFVDELFEFVVAMEVAFARAQFEAGADLIGVGDAAASLVGPRFYAEFVLPYEKRLVAAHPGDGGPRAAAHLRQHPQDPRGHGHARLRHRGPRFPVAAGPGARRWGRARCSWGISTRCRAALVHPGGDP